MSNNLRVYGPIQYLIYIETFLDISRRILKNSRVFHWAILVACIVAATIWKGVN